VSITWNLSSKISKEKELIVFNVGDMVVYRSYGVGIVESVEKRQVGENELSFYALKIQNMIISVPTAKSSKMGLRAIISAVETEKVYKILRERDIDPRSWRERHKECIDKINSGSVYAVAEAYRDLHLAKVKRNKAWSFSDRKIMNQAKIHLIKELAIANQADEFQVEQQLEQIFSEK
jgi:RNA polymerase-interacting CarD/CdnL/TRCF family regulator